MAIQTQIGDPAGFACTDHVGKYISQDMTGSELDWPSVERLANAVAPRQLSTGVQHGVLGEKISEGIMIVEVDSARLSDRKHFAGAFDRLIVRHGAFVAIHKWKEPLLFPSVVGDSSCFRTVKRVRLHQIP